MSLSVELKSHVVHASHKQMNALVFKKLDYKL